MAYRRKGKAHMTQSTVIDRDQQIEVLREMWEAHTGLWDYGTFTAALYADVAEDFTISRTLFDQFTTEINDGTRCINCGHFIDSIASARLCEGCWHDEIDSES